MPLIRLIQALSTGAASFGLNPILPPLPAKAAAFNKTPSEAFAGDALKLAGDFKYALTEVANEVDAGGKSVSVKT